MLILISYKLQWYRGTKSENEGPQNICLLHQSNYLTGVYLNVINIKIWNSSDKLNYTIKQVCYNLTSYNRLG